MIYIEKQALIDWILKELKARKSPGKEDEYVANCPFCDHKENHWDYTINVNKKIMNCWRGFDPRCESGHNILTLISLYYDISLKKAQEFIKKKFQTEDSILRIKKRLKNLDQDRILYVADDRVVWPIPKEANPLLKSSGPDAKKAIDWLLNTRQIPMEMIKELNPYYLNKETNVDFKLKKYHGRVFFDIKSDGNSAWLAYSTRKKSTKKNPKTMNPPGRILSSMLFLYDYYIDSHKPVLLNEGYFDSLRLFLFDYNALAGFGTTISAEQIDLLNRLPTNEIVVCYDPDATALKQDKKGKWTSRAYRTAKILSNHYFGDVSVMELKREDPDRSSYREVKIAYKNRRRFGDRLWRLKKLHKQFEETKHVEG